MRHQQGNVTAMRIAAWVMVFVAAVFVGVAAFRLGSRSMDVSFARPAPIPDAAEQEDLPDRAELEAMLHEVGLNPRPVLGDIGVAGHMARLDRAQISPWALVHYANGLKELNEATARSGVAIPTAFWDVESPALLRAGWTPYAIVDHLNRPENAPHLWLLARAYERFETFKTSEGQHRQTAVDAAFDLLDIASDFVAALSDTGLATLAPGIGTRADAAIVVWQNLLTGAPDIRRKIAAPPFAPGLVGRFNVATMHQHKIGAPQPVDMIWGRTGFAERFGVYPDVSGQVKWMTLSAAHQTVLNTPRKELDALDEARLAAEPANAVARMHLVMNAVVQEHFIPDYTTDLDVAASRLKAAVQSDW